MATFTKRKLSGSTDGKGIKVTQTATPGDTIHTATTGTSAADDYDEIYLYAVNANTLALKLTVEFGGTTSPDNLIEMTIPGESGLECIVPGLPLQNGAVVKAFCASANLVMIYGYVNRIAP